MQYLWERSRDLEKRLKKESSRKANKDWKQEEKKKGKRRAGLEKENYGNNNF